jgi:hypothetical protein
MKNIVMILITPITIVLSLIDLLQLCIVLLFLLFQNKEVNQYIKNNFISVDQRVNTLFLGNEDETLSSRMGKHLAKRD